MSKVTVYDSEYITVEYWTDKKLVYHTIHKPISSQLPTFKEALNAGTETLEKYKATKWLSDDRKNDPLTKEGNEWAFGEWQPRTLKAGWKYWAAVVPQSLVAAGTLIPVIDNLFQLGLRMMVFSNVEEAVSWLDEMKEESA
jgi:hypothetical protein